MIRSVQSAPKVPLDSKILDRLTALESSVTQHDIVLAAFVAAGIQIIPGNGVPSNTALPAKAGSLFIRLDGSAGHRWYVRSESNTWVAIASV